MAGWVTKVTKLEVEVKDLKESNTELSAKTEDLENQLAEVGVYIMLVCLLKISETSQPFSYRSKLLS